MSKTIKVVINNCYGGFSLSTEALKRYNEGRDEPMYGYDIDRDDPKLIEILETIGLHISSGRFSKLVIVKIPDDVDWEVDDHEGWEWVAEKHRTWRAQ